MWKVNNRFCVPMTQELKELMRELIPKHIVESAQGTASHLFILHNDLENPRYTWLAFHMLYDEVYARYYIHLLPIIERQEHDGTVVVFNDIQPIGLLNSEALGHYLEKL